MFKRVLLIGMLVAVAAAIWFAWNQRCQPVEVEVGKVVYSHLESAFVAEGFVRAKIHDLSPSKPGRVTRIFVREGEAVKKGQVLLQVEDVDAQDGITLARAALASARRQEAEAVSTHKAASTAAYAKILQARKRVLVAEARMRAVQSGPRKEEVAKAENEMASLEAVAAELNRRLQRAKKLADAGVVPIANVEAVQAESDAAAARVRAAKEVVRLLEAGPKPEEVEVASREIAAAQSDVKVAESGLQEVEAIRRRVDSARSRSLEAMESVAAAEHASTKASLFAPEDGTVSKLMVELGTWAAPGVPAVILVTRADLHVEAEIRAEDLGDVAVGAPVEVVLPARPEDALRGSIQWLAKAGEPKPDSTIGTQIVRCRVEVEDSRLMMPGTEVDVRFRASRDMVLTVPSEAIRLDGASPKVWRIENGRVQRVSVDIGSGDGDQTEVRRGLSEGEAVVVGDADLEEGQQVVTRGPS